MPHYIIKLTKGKQSWYLEWSTICDAPITYGMSLEEFKDYYQKEYGLSSMVELQRRLDRVEAKGTSSLIHDSLGELLACNRAGDNEQRITKDKIIKKYCIDQPKK